MIWRWMFLKTNILTRIIKLSNEFQSVLNTVFGPVNNLNTCMYLMALWDPEALKKLIEKSAYLCTYVPSLHHRPMVSVVLDQEFISLPSQQVLSSSPALSTQAQSSQPVITDSTWEEYQQAQTLEETATTFQSTALFHNFKTPGGCSHLPWALMNK